MFDNTEYVFPPKRYIDPSDLVKDLDTSAQNWARAFMGTIARGHFTRNDIDEGLMISWFASAIETTKDAVHSERTK